MTLRPINANTARAPQPWVAGSTVERARHPEPPNGSSGTEIRVIRITVNRLGSERLLANASLYTASNYVRLRSNVAPEGAPRGAALRSSLVPLKRRFLGDVGQWGSPCMQRNQPNSAASVIHWCRGQSLSGVDDQDW